MRCFFIFALSLLVTPLALAGPKLYVFDCGTVFMDDVSAFGLDNDETDVRELAVPCYLVENKGEYLLWDGGLPLAAAGKERHLMGGAFDIVYQRSLVDQLGDLGLSTGEIDYTAYSHFHFDHVGAANLFPDAKLMIQGSEYQAAFENHEQYQVFQYDLYAQLVDSDIAILQGKHDVFGDGSAVIVPAPGHTPGHQVLLVNLDNLGPLVLSGDLYHFEFSRTHRRVPTFNTDKSQTLASMEAIEQLVASTGASFWIQHNKSLYDTLDKAPAFYD